MVADQEEPKLSPSEARADRRAKKLAALNARLAKRKVKSDAKQRELDAKQRELDAKKAADKAAWQAAEQARFDRINAEKSRLNVHLALNRLTRT